MAVTKIWKVVKRMDHVISYAKDENKTKIEFNQKYEMLVDDLQNVIDYARNSDKTEKEYFVTGINCDSDSAYEEMQDTKRYYNKKDKILAFHAYQSFAEGEVTPELAHQIGVQLANEMWGDRFQVVVTTHLNTNHIHNHIVLNSVSFEDGLKYYDNHTNYAKMRHISDELCKEYGLSVIEEKATKKKMNYDNFYKKSLYTDNYSNNAKRDLDLAIRQAYSYDDFLYLMKKLDYEIIFRANKISIRKEPYKRNIRIERRYGENYSIENLNGYGRTAIAKKLNELGILNPTGHRAIDLKMKTPFKNNTDKVTYSWCSTTIRDILRNQMYCGDLVQNKGKLISYKIHKRVLVPQEEWIIVKDTHDAIIDRDTFNKVQKAILNRDTRMNTDGKISIFAGHIKCGDCQRAMSKKIPGKYKGQPRNYYHYMCSAYMRSGGEICTKHSIKNDELEKAVLESVKVQIGLIIDMKRIKGQIDSKTFNDNRRSYLLENINKCEETLNIKRKLRKEAYEDWKLGIITEKEYNDYTQEYGRQIRENEAYIEENYKELQNLDKMSTSGEWIEYFEKYQNVNSLSRELIDGLIDDIYVYEDKKIKVKFKYEDEYNYLIQYIKRRKGDIL